MPLPLSESEIARELVDYQVVLSSEALPKLALYLELLLQWNQKINLTGIKDQRTIVRRLFGESLYLANVLELKGTLVDIGSGAGFPGLALKLAAPNLHVTLVEVRHKKCAFLKEVAARCGFEGVEVVRERFEDWAAGTQAQADIVTTRAVDVAPELLQTAKELIAPSGRLVLFTSSDLASSLRQIPGWHWLPFRPYPNDPSHGLQTASH